MMHDTRHSGTLVLHIYLKSGLHDGCIDSLRLWCLIICQAFSYYRSAGACQSCASQREVRDSLPEAQSLTAAAHGQWLHPCAIAGRVCVPGCSVSVMHNLRPANCHCYSSYQQGLARVTQRPNESIFILSCCKNNFTLLLASRPFTYCTKAESCFMESSCHPPRPSSSCDA